MPDFAERRTLYAAGPSLRRVAEKGAALPTETRAGTSQMTWLLKLIDRLIENRRHRWVEISLSRAWDSDMPPSLFDIDTRP